MRFGVLALKSGICLITFRGVLEGVGFFEVVFPQLISHKN